MGVNNNFFVDQSDILNAINEIVKGTPVGKSTSLFDLKKMEADLKKNIWIKNAELFFDNNEILRVNVNEREPVARVFTTTGSTFYIDNDIAILPLSEKFSARLPVFTGFPADNKLLSVADSNLLKDIREISLAIQKDSFLMAMIEQVDINKQRTFEMLPKIGNQVIVFGDASDTEEKFIKLSLFYKNVMMKAGWNYYSFIDLQYKNQVVAKRRGAEDVTADSLRTLQLIQLIAANAEKKAADALPFPALDNDKNALDSSMIQHSIQRDDHTEKLDTIKYIYPDAKPVIQPVLNSSNPKSAKKETQQNVIPVKKPIPNEVKKIVGNEKFNKQQPKAAMPKQNDYK